MKPNYTPNDRSEFEKKANWHMFYLVVGFLGCLLIFGLVTAYLYNQYEFENHSEIQYQDIAVAQMDSLQTARNLRFNN